MPTVYTLKNIWVTDRNNLQFLRRASRAWHNITGKMQRRAATGLLARILFGVVVAFHLALKIVLSSYLKRNLKRFVYHANSFTKKQYLNS
jgi:hypothetical protein